MDWPSGTSHQKATAASMIEPIIHPLGRVIWLALWEFGHIRTLFA
jgi:hypothetical protein